MESRQFKVAKAILTLLLCLSFQIVAGQTDIEAGMILEIPELNIQVEPNGSKVLPSNHLSYFQVHIHGRGINSGAIHTRINTESANIIMTSFGGEDGILCKFDLNLRGGFQINPGRNSVEIGYRDAYERPHYASYLLVVPEKSNEASPPAPVKAVQRTGVTYAVIVGIAKYARGGFGIQNLKYADRDASAFLAFLQSPAGGTVRTENIRVLLNEEATNENLRTALYTFLTKPTVNDTVLVFLAGHGMADPNDERNLYFLTYDTDPNNMGGTAFPMSDLQDIYQRVIKAKRVITFADSCHSFGVSGQRALGSKENNLTNQYLKKYAETGERDVITASDVSQAAQEDERWGGGHGVFTYFLLQGLQGKAADGNGNVLAGNLFQYVKEQVRRATGDSQTPQMAYGAAAGIPLSGPVVRSHSKLAAKNPGDKSPGLISVHQRGQ